LIDNATRPPTVESNFQVLGAVSRSLRPLSPAPSSALACPA
jgi:hypothetical protein